MSSSGKNKTLVVGAIAACVVGAGAAALVYSMNKGKQSHVEEEDEDAFTAPLPKIDEPAKTVPAVRVAPVEPVPQPEAKTMPAIPAVRPAPAKEKKEEEDLDRLLDEAQTEVQEVTETKASAPASVVPANAAVAAPAAAAGGVMSFPHLGIELTPPSGWLVREELSPMPNIAMLTVSKPEFAEQMESGAMGQVPVIILSIEDISGENMDLFEFKEKSKHMALEQMLMMTQGMIHPVVKEDKKRVIGVFSHQLEYTQSIPPLFDIAVRNLLQVHSGLAYVFQIMCSPSVLNTYSSAFETIAKSIKFTASRDNALGTIEVCTGKVKINAHPTWTWRYPGARNALVSFTTTSSIKREVLSLYPSKDTPAQYKTSTQERTVDDVRVSNVKSGAKTIKKFEYGDWTMIVEPQEKTTSFLEESLVIHAIKSAEESTTTAAIKNGATFINPDHGYKFNAVGGSRVVATRIGGGTVVYAPKGIPSDPTKVVPEEEQGPTVTIRVGSPENDPECMSSLDEWQERMEKETASSDITNIQRSDINGLDCLTFISKETQEVGPGQQVKLQGKVLIFVRDGKTTLIRWETASSVWRKNERDLEAFVKGFEFI